MFTHFRSASANMPQTFFTLCSQCLIWIPFTEINDSWCFNSQHLRLWISLPLTHLQLETYHVIPLPIWITCHTYKFLYIQPEKDYLIMDTTKQYYTKLSLNEFSNCKKLKFNCNVCKQFFPILSTYVHDEWEAKLLQYTRTIPENCNKCVVHLEQTLWT